VDRHAKGVGMEYWQHRISWLTHVSRPLLEKGYLPAGWSDFSDRKFLTKASSGDSDYFNRRFLDTWGDTPANRYFLWRFLAEMKEGDLVVVPDSRIFSVYRLTEAHAILPQDAALDWGGLVDQSGRKIMLDGNNRLALETEGGIEALDFGFLRKAEPVERDIPRAGYAKAALQRRMKARATTLKITDLADEVQAALEAWRAKKPLNLKSILIDGSSALWLRLVRENLSPDKFEQLVRCYLDRSGATVTTVPAKNEPGKSGDIDVVAEFAPIRTTVYVQAKFHNHEDDDWAVRQVKDYIEAQKSGGGVLGAQYWVISTADSFSTEAVRLAEEHNIRLITGQEFVGMLMEVGIQDMDI